MSVISALLYGRLLSDSLPSYHHTTDFSILTLSTRSRVSWITKFGSSFWIKWPQPLACIGPLLKFGSVSPANPWLYSCHIGLAYFILRDLGVPIAWILSFLQVSGEEYILANFLQQKRRNHDQRPISMASLSQYPELGGHCRAISPGGPDGSDPLY